MEPAVIVVLERGVNFPVLTAPDALNTHEFLRIQSEVKDRFSGFHRSPQQVESLAAEGDRL